MDERIWYGDAALKYSDAECWERLQDGDELDCYDELTLKQHELDSATREISRRVQQIRVMQQTVDSVSIQWKELRDRSMVIGAEHNSELQRLRMEIGQLEQAQFESQAALFRKDALLTQVTLELGKTNGLLESSRTQCQSLQSCNDNLCLKIQELQGVVAELKETAAHLESTKALCRGLQSSNYELFRRVRECQARASEAEGYRREAQHLRREYDAIRRELSDVKHCLATAEGFRERCAFLERRNNLLEKKLVCDTRTEREVGKIASSLVRDFVGIRAPNRRAGAWRGLMQLMLTSPVLTNVTMMMLWRDYFENHVPALVKGAEVPLLFRGFSVVPSEFHSACDGRGPTLVIVVTRRGSVFGGMTQLSWSSTGFWKQGSDNDTALFVLSSPKVSDPLFFLLTPGASFSVGHYSNWGPCFGTNDLCLREGVSYSEFPASFCPVNDRTDRSVFDGSADGTFEVALLEVYELPREPFRFGRGGDARVDVGERVTPWSSVLSNHGAENSSLGGWAAGSVPVPTWGGPAFEGARQGWGVHSGDGHTGLESSASLDGRSSAV